MVCKKIVNAIRRSIHPIHYIDKIAKRKNVLRSITGVGGGAGRVSPIEFALPITRCTHGITLLKCEQPIEIGFVVH